MDITTKRNNDLLQLSFTTLVKKFYSYFLKWRQNSKTRKDLSELPDYLLEDIGVSKVEANKESSRPFWD
ncbi:DUF1127 domain-containing protein [Vibrio sp. 99-70-13A1]|uniref:DUF1127 domain-containing protein n=1 Tax=Vibrio sp. 99-70-13A1 TaxID=2607601 RepID=UPI001493BF01|nr:DUF1127 domain-containing protein [Vibrio sp. 99-70-13A1]NOH97347.1 DUF1127 domain-containing protein [Vibrio sp. 99-70-13A1]